ncbi:MAG: TlpA family protein disulfide reductase [Candidatus Cloacimonetes bacterium]|nr:TlpA family protein disulfide reductase [Candidatus Cloacimonadota bacterium]
MKKIMIIIMLLCLGLLFASEKQQQAGDFQLQDADGNLVRLSDVNDKLVLIDFWASWCAPCKKALPHLSSFQEKYADDLVVLAINIDKPRHQSKAQAYIKSNGYLFTNLFDPEQVTLKLFNVVNPPRTILVAPGMNIVYTHDGYKRGDEIEIEENIVKWLNMKPEKEAVAPEGNAGNFYISGMNKLAYVYRTAEDSLHHYIDNELSFAANYNKFRFGMTYNGELPKYDRFAPDEYLDNSDIKHEWVERYGEYNGENLFVRAGNYETVFGSGMVIHAYNNTDMNVDERLDGVQMRIKYDNFMLQGIYGSLANKEYPEYDDVVTGADFSYNLSKMLTLGGSTLSYRSYVNGIDYQYNRRDVFDGRISINTKIIELSAEYAANKKYWDIVEDLEGSALFGNMNLYLGKFRFTAAYKDYENFNQRLAELPTVNHCEEPIAEYGQWSLPGYDEEGVQGIISWKPDDKNELELNYSEGWASDDNVSQSDFYGTYKHDFASWGLNAEYRQMERLDDSVEEYKWNKEIAPRLEADFMIAAKPVLVRVEWKRQQHDNYGEEEDYSEPLFQVDFGIYKNYSLSVLSSLKFQNDEDITKSEGKLGVELFAPIWEHTDIRLFAGSEKGGKVCRNGVCNDQSPFEGIRLDVTTRF